MSRLLRLTRTGIGLLTRQYRSVLKKCWLINVGLFTAGVVLVSNEAVAEVSAMESTLDKIRGESLSYLSNPHQTYDLVTTKGDNTNSIIISGTTYYYTPSEGSAAANQKLVNLANTGGGAVYNAGTLGAITGNVTGNRATSGLGGAIYTEGDITIATDADNDILFNNNKDSGGYNDIYTKGGTVNLSAEDGRTITFNGSVIGTNAAGDSNGAYIP